MSSDGPQTPSRVQINEAVVGCLSHCGYSHGGNGYEGMAFILEQFKDVALADPTDARSACRGQAEWIGAVNRAEALHGKYAASLEKVEHGNARKFAERRDELAGPARLEPHRR